MGASKRKKEPDESDLILIMHPLVLEGIRSVARTALIEYAPGSNEAEFQLIKHVVEWIDTLDEIL